MSRDTQIPQSPEQRGSVPQIVSRRLEVTEFSGLITLTSTRLSNEREKQRLYEIDMRQAAKDAQRQIQEEKMKSAIVPSTVAVEPTINPNNPNKLEQTKTQLDFSRPAYGANASYMIPEQPESTDLSIQSPSEAEPSSSIQTPVPYDQEQSISAAQASVEDAYRITSEDQHGIPA